jgi:uncharacterized protein (DUF1330 family)
MKTQYTVALAMLAGVGIGATAIQGLYAQTNPPSLVVIDISEITDTEGFKAVGQRSNAAATAVFKDLSGRYVVRTNKDKITALNGAPPNRFVIVAFDNAEKAQAWYNSPTQKEVNAIVAKTTKSRAFLVEGM